MRLSLRRQPVEVERSNPSLSLNEFVSYFTFDGLAYGYNQTLVGEKQEQPTGEFRSLASLAYKSDGVVFACMLLRLLLFSEARFKYRQLRSGRPGQLFGTPDLALLETPWPGGTTGDLLARAIQDADLAGNAFFVRRPGGLRRLRPDWVEIILGSMEDSDVAAWDPDAVMLGVTYQPGGPAGGKPKQVYTASEVAHFAPIPDPLAQFRGMSWLTPIVREVMADKAATSHKLKFFENGATPNLVVKIDTSDLEVYKRWVEDFTERHEGAANAYRTLFLAAGSDATVVGSDLQQMDFKVTQGAGETRIAAAAGTPPVLVGLSEGLDAATYSNYGQARRRFADATMRPLWRNIAGSLARVITVPGGSELWYDDRDIPFLAEDQKDSAEVAVKKAAAIRQYVDGGFEPESAVNAVESGDLTLLVHTGNLSVQLQPGGLMPVPAANGASAN